jgi:anti-anti-sigma regulatory factor
MAKYRHRIFEMYELRDEAIRALTPRTETAATEATAPETWSFTHLDVSRIAGLLQIQFKAPRTFDDTTASAFRQDLARLTALMGRDSKVLVDFSGVVSFNATSIGALAQFNRNLQTKGSRMAICCVEPGTRESFFAG